VERSREGGSIPDLESRDRAASFAPPDLPDMDINFSPHDKPRSQTLMDAIARAS